MELITSIQNERVKLVRTLQDKARARRKHMRIAVEGTRLVRDAWGRGSRPDFVRYDPDAADTALVNKMTKARVNRDVLLPAIKEEMAELLASEEAGDPTAMKRYQALLKEAKAVEAGAYLISLEKPANPEADDLVA